MILQSTFSCIFVVSVILNLDANPIYLSFVYLFIYLYICDRTCEKGPCRASFQNRVITTIGKSRL